MREDIKTVQIKEAGVGITKENDNVEWSVNLISLRSWLLQNQLVTLKGNAESGDKKTRTSLMNRYFEEATSKSYIGIEFINEDIFGITNEFFISFWWKKQSFDKCVFLIDNIQADYFTTIPILNKGGVLIL